MKPPSEWIAAPQNTIAVLQKYDFQFKKSLGQNFLIDLRVVDKILKTSKIGPEDECLEIGPGIGSLTQALAERGARVTAVEIDQNLIPILEENLADYPRTEIVNADFLSLDLPSFFAQHFTKPVKVIANLPYYITTPILMGLLESRVPLVSLTVMVQEEVAERMKAGPGSKDYGALSLAIQYYTQPELAAHVPLNCFMPRPKVGSALMHLTCRSKPPVETADEKRLFQVIRASFSKRRKTLVNSLSSAPELGVSKEKVQEALKKEGLSPTIRGEALTLTQFARLADDLYTI